MWLGSGLSTDRAWSPGAYSVQSFPLPTHSRSILAWVPSTVHQFHGCSYLNTTQRCPPYHSCALWTVAPLKTRRGQPPPPHSRPPSNRHVLVDLTTSSLPSDDNITHENDPVIYRATTPYSMEQPREQLCLCSRQLHHGFIRATAARLTHCHCSGRWWLQLACDRVHGQIARCHPGVCDASPSYQGITRPLIAVACACAESIAPRR